jgi:hypothetical protein
MGIYESTLGLTEAGAREQWRRISRRSLIASRQEAYLPVEIILCMSLFRILRPNSYGGGNIHTLPQEAKALAAAFKRPPGSITSKMLNLKGDRANGALREPELYRALTQPQALESLHAIVIAAARAEGFDNHQVPDVLTGRSRL